MEDRQNTMIGFYAVWVSFLSDRTLRSILPPPVLRLIRYSLVYQKATLTNCAVEVYVYLLFRFYNNHVSLKSGLLYTIY
jgi:hypothetical protein